MIDNTLGCFLHTYLIIILLSLKEQNQLVLNFPSFFISLQPILSQVLDLIDRSKTILITFSYCVVEIYQSC